MKVTSKIAKIFFASVFIIALALFLIWEINREQNKKILAEANAIYFDECMEASYPVLTNVALALYYQAGIYENNAKEAKRYCYNYDTFVEKFTELNNQYLNHTDIGTFIFIWNEQYEQLWVSWTSTYLVAGSELREQESKAIVKIEGSRQRLRKLEDLNSRSDITPDSIITECLEIKVAVSEAKRDIEKYRLPYQNADAWRKEVKPQKSKVLYEKYEARKNWPFTFLNKTK